MLETSKEKIVMIAQLKLLKVTFLEFRNAVFWGLISLCAA